MRRPLVTASSRRKRVTLEMSATTALRLSRLLHDLAGPLGQHLPREFQELDRALYAAWNGSSYPPPDDQR